MIKFISMLISLSLFGLHGFAQSAGKSLYDGNKNYHQGNFKQAETDYKKAFGVKKNREAQFNLGNAQYQQKNFEEANKQYTEVAQSTRNPKLQASAHYNRGNTFLEQQKWDEAIASYKQSLKLDPSNADAKYNLAYAQRKKQMQDKQKEKEKEKDKEKDDQQKDKEKDKEKEKEKEKENQQENQQQQEQKQNKPQPMPSKITKDQADQLLNALNQEEKKLKEKKEHGQGVPIQTDKDW